MKLLIKNIRGLVGARTDAPPVLKGKALQSLPVLEDAWLAIEDGRLADFGGMDEWPGISDWRDLEVIDADGKFVFPSWCDSHSHVVYAGNREQEFVDRIHGLTYEEIAARGGGILQSAMRLRSATEQQLFDAAWQRLNEVMALGTGAIEIKSGYGLDLESELKMLRVIRRLQAEHPLTIRSTFLGAHAVPPEFKGRKQEYVDHIIQEMLPAIAAERLADFVDVFCEQNYFSNIDTQRIIEAGARHGLSAKIHVNQFTVSGGIATATKAGALSVDHLEVLDDADLLALRQSNTMPVALPGCSLFLRIPYTPGRKLIDAGLPLALASDFNPGSCPSGNMGLVVSLACIQMGISPEEAIQAATVNGAYAMDIAADHGAIVPGFKANFFITREMPSVGFLPYSFGSQLVQDVYIDGKKR
jgi:imidazolonepropionase